MSVPILQRQLLSLTLHDVLPVDPVLHERNRPRVSVLVGRRTHGRRFDDDVVDDAAGYQEVRDEDEEEHLVGGRLSNPGRLLQLQVRDRQKRKDRAQKHLHDGRR